MLECLFLFIYFQMPFEDWGHNYASKVSTCCASMKTRVSLGTCIKSWGSGSGKCWEDTDSGSLRPLASWPTTCSKSMRDPALENTVDGA